MIFFIATKAQRLKEFILEKSRNLQSRNLVIPQSRNLVIPQSRNLVISQSRNLVISQSRNLPIPTPLTTNNYQLSTPIPLSTNNYQLSTTNYQLSTILLLFLCSCANVKPPEGGPKDVTPPAVVAAHSTPDFQVNFQKQRIELTFDEWVKLEDTYNQVLISPPLDEQPKIKLHGKTVRVELAEKEVLRPNTTYTINFGNSVKDITEANPAKDLRFVFSTGPFLDSLSVNAEIRSLITNEPVENVLLLLYDNLADSVVRTQRPFYFGKSDKKGLIRISNVRAGTYKAFALMDANLNYLFDQDNEKIGFPDRLLQVGGFDRAVLSLRVFEPYKKLRRLDQNVKSYGRASIAFNRPPTDATFQYDDVGQKVWYETLNDSLIIWYDLPRDTSWQFYIRQDTSYRDTVLIRSSGRADFLAKTTLLAAGQASPAAGTSLKRKSAETAIIQQHPFKPFRLSFNHPLDQVDTQNIRLYEDSTFTLVEVTKALIDSADHKVMLISYPWKEDKHYWLELLPGAVRDFYGARNDTLRQHMVIPPRKNFGDIRLKITSLDSSKTYIIQLLVGEREEAAFYPSGITTFETFLQTLQPGQYAVRIIEDNNRNKRWDTGNYDLHLQPERIYQHKLDQLRPNWELEATLDLKEF